MLALLQQTYWAERCPAGAVENMIQHSVCISLFEREDQIDFGPAVADYTVFSWLADIVIDPAYRECGLGKWLVSRILEHPDLRATQFVVQTRDAHALYERFGFSRSPKLMSTAVCGL